VWQGLYDELKDKNFLIIAVAFDTGGVAAVKEWIRPAAPTQLPKELLDIMGWEDTLSRNAATPTYPCLVDEKHLWYFALDFVPKFTSNSAIPLGAIQRIARSYPHRRPHVSR
jgi:hypothetical protein